MKVLGNYISSIYRYSRKKCIQTLIFMILDGITGGIGILMLIPLLSLTGIVGESKSILGVKLAFPWLQSMDKAFLLIVVLATYILLIILQAAISRKLSMLNTEIMQGYTGYLRIALFDRIVKAQWSYLSGKRKSDITNAFTNEITKIASGTIYLLRTASQFLLALVQIGIAFFMSPPLTIFVLASGAAILFIMRSTLKESSMLGSSLRQFNQKLMRSVTEHLNSIKEVKSYGIEESQLQYFEETAQDTYQNVTEFMKLQSKTTLYYKIFAAFVISFLFYIAAVLLKIEPVKLVIIVYIFAKLWPVFSSLQNNLQNIYIMLPSYSELQKLMDELEQNLEKLTKFQEKPMRLLQAAIRFQQVSFHYDSKDAFELKDINLEIPVRKLVAIVGRSGSGKSTLVDLLLGLLKPLSGEILVDDMLVCEKTMSQWRHCIGYVPQDPFLYNATIKENLIRFTPDATEEQLRQALLQSDAYEFVMKLPSGIETVVGDNGVRLSGGQRQRIVLARALLRNPELLVLDEATSSLDNESEYRIQKAVEALSGKITIVVIAHRLSTIRNADRIIVIDRGKVAESGTYEELLHKEDGCFFHMVNVREALYE